MRREVSDADINKAERKANRKFATYIDAKKKIQVTQAIFQDNSLVSRIRRRINRFLDNSYVSRNHSKSK